MKSSLLSVFRHGILLMGIGLICFLGRFFYFRIDLTEDKRYSLHAVTKNILADLEEELHVTVYLEGDLPTGFKQLRRATRELLEECKVYARHHLQYQFIDLDKVPSDQKKDVLQKLAAKGIQPTNLRIQEKSQHKEKIIFPAAWLTYKDQEEGILLLKGSRMISPAQMLNQSMENLEYEWVHAVKKLLHPQRQSVALLRGHGEPDLKQLRGLIDALGEHYEVHILNFSAQSVLKTYDALFITKPQQSFSEAEKYLLDQYIMQGGKVLFFLDRVRINMDHLHHQATFAFPLDVGLDDQLFKYGIRINPDLVQDLHAGVYPVVVGNLGNQPQLNMLKWPFSPILNCFAEHLVTKNMDALYPQFVSSIDPIQTPDVIHTPLVFTSPYSKRISAPVHIDLEALRKPLQSAQYQCGHIPLAFLLEGNFTSLYQNRFLPESFDEATFVPTSQPTKLLVVASGSLILNAIDPHKKQFLPWGYDPFLQQHFANKDFVLNALAYMLDEHGLIKLKNKTLQIRLLDQVRLAQDRLWWQLVNLTLPLLLLGLIGVVWNYLYRRAYKKC